MRFAALLNNLEAISESEASIATSSNFENWLLIRRHHSPSTFLLTFGN